MCVYNVGVLLDKMRRRKQRCHAWKVLYKDGRSPFAWSLYGPGVCKAKLDIRSTHEGRFFEYSLDAPQGLHLWCTRRKAKHFCARDEYIIKVTFNPKDVIAVDQQEIAVTQLRIMSDDWKKAGFPKAKSTTRLIRSNRSNRSNRP